MWITELMKDMETWLWEIEYETKVKEAYVKKQQFFGIELINIYNNNKRQREKKS